MSLDTSAWSPEQWEGRARMAAARASARSPLDAIDREALRRNPAHAEGLGGDVTVIGDNLQEWKASAERLGGYKRIR